MTHHLLVACEPAAVDTEGSVCCYTVTTPDPNPSNPITTRQNMTCGINASYPAGLPVSRFGNVWHHFCK